MPSALLSLVTILALVAPASAQAERPLPEAAPEECPRCGHPDGARRLGERGRERLERRIERRLGAAGERRLERRLEQRLERRSELRERVERHLREQGRGKEPGARRAERGERLRERRTR